jgi:hypothetical protein
VTMRPHTQTLPCRGLVLVKLIALCFTHHISISSLWILLYVHTIVYIVTTSFLCFSSNLVFSNWYVLWHEWVVVFWGVCTLCVSEFVYACFCALSMRGMVLWATVNQHPPVHHPLDVCYDSVVDDPQLSYYLVSSW